MPKIWFTGATDLTNLTYSIDLTNSTNSLLLRDHESAGQRYNIENE